MKTNLRTLTLPALLMLALGSAAVLAQNTTPGTPGAPMQGRATERFKAADTDGDGMLSKEEAQRGMPRLAERFAALDTNQDGKISADEMQAMRNNMRGAGRPDGAGAGAAGGMRHAAMRGGGKAGAGCAMGAADSDGRVTRASVEKTGRPAALTRFDALDTDKDGVLSPSEQAACPMQRK